MAKRDKYGSPYDPKNGKEHPKARSEGRHSGGFASGGLVTPSDMSTVNLVGFERAALSMRHFSEAIDRMALESIFGDVPAWTTTVEFGERSARAPAGPPSTYIAAREAVKKWIVDAPDQSFDDIIGNDEALEQLRDAIEAPVKHKALYEAYGLKMPKGALLSGPPGCGKTMFARAAASEMKRLYGMGVEFLCLSGGDLQTMYWGATEKMIRELFAFAREYKAYRGHPLLIFIDEADCILPDRTGRVRHIHSFEESQVATFLAEMDGIQESGAFVMLASNRPEVIDQAVLRDGRCDFKITVQRPTREALEQILRRNFAGVPVAQGCSIDELAFAAVESFHDPHKVILEASMIGIDFEKEKVHRRDKHFLLEHVVSGAMAASIPARAKRLAFARDKAAGVVTGVTVGDVVEAITAVHQENRGLDHSFALEDFKRTFFQEARESIEQERTPPPRQEGRLN